jgi:hypothetical protein
MDLTRFDKHLVWSKLNGFSMTGFDDKGAIRELTLGATKQTFSIKVIGR